MRQRGAGQQGLDATTGLGRADEPGHAPGTQREVAAPAGRPPAPLFAALTFGALAALLAAGCGRLSAAFFEETWGPDEPPLRLSPGDSVEIRFPGAPELSGTQTIRADGMVSLDLVGEVTAAGRTPAELAAHLGRVHAPHLLDPSAVVIVRSSSERRVLVSGAVRRPGPVPMPGPLSAFEAIMLAGGFDETAAETRSVLLVRRGPDGRYAGAALDMRRALRGRPSHPVRLRPLDIIYVPRTRIVRINQWIGQHLGAIVPGLGLTYSRRTSETESVGVTIDGTP